MQQQTISMMRMHVALLIHRLVWEVCGQQQSNKKKTTNHLFHVFNGKKYGEHKTLAVATELWTPINTFTKETQKGGQTQTRTNWKTFNY